VTQDGPRRGPWCQICLARAEATHAIGGGSGPPWRLRRATPAHEARETRAQADVSGCQIKGRIRAIRGAREALVRGPAGWSGGLRTLEAMLFRRSPGRERLRRRSRIVAGNPGGPLGPAVGACSWMIL